MGGKMAELPIVVQILSPLKETECDFVPENCITTVSVGSVFLVLLTYLPSQVTISPVENPV